MIQGLLKKFTRKIKTKRRSPLDCSDFIDALPVAPSHDRIRSVVLQRLYGAKPAPSSDAETEQRNYAIKATVFDLQYRCGAAGRCVASAEGASGIPACRFPCCFTLRPLTKGAEIMAERSAYEHVTDEMDDATKALVQLADADMLHECQEGIQRLAHQKITMAAAGKPISNLLQISETKEFSAAEPKVGESSDYFGENPLRSNAALRDEIASLYLWRAALLVNLRRDENAVSSLLNLAMMMENESRLRLFVAAAGWATLNDMEIIYYRSFVQQHDSIPVAKEFSLERSTLLRRVFEACAGDSFLVQHAAHMTFSKEVTALVSRAQAAQMHGDSTEDPMGTLCIPLALQYYRFFISDEFWQHFFNLLVMPPAPPPEREDANDPMRELNLTPPHVLDAVARSIMLHHLMLLHDGRERERDSGALGKFAEKAGATPSVEDQARMNSILDGRQAGIAAMRLRELVTLIKGNDTQAALMGAKPSPSLASSSPKKTDSSPPSL